MKNEIMKPFSKLKFAAVFALTGLVPMLAGAHPFHGVTNGFAGGIAHPLSGLDHILAMVAVGLWAAQLGGRSRWMVPAAFVSLMIVGGALGIRIEQAALLQSPDHGDEDADADRSN